MLHTKAISIAILSIFIALTSVTPAYPTVIELDDMNIIIDPGNPSDGLRFLDVNIIEIVLHADSFH